MLSWIEQAPILRRVHVGRGTLPKATSAFPIPSHPIPIAFVRLAGLRQALTRST